MGARRLLLVLVARLAAPCGCGGGKAETCSDFTIIRYPIELCQNERSATEGFNYCMRSDIATSVRNNNIIFIANGCPSHPISQGVSRLSSSSSCSCSSSGGCGRSGGSGCAASGGCCSGGCSVSGGGCSGSNGTSSGCTSGSGCSASGSCSASGGCSSGNNTGGCSPSGGCSSGNSTGGCCSASSGCGSASGGCSSGFSGGCSSGSSGGCSSGSSGSCGGCSSSCCSCVWSEGGGGACAGCGCGGASGGGCGCGGCGCGGCGCGCCGGGPIYKYTATYHNYVVTIPRIPRLLNISAAYPTNGSVVGIAVNGIPLFNDAVCNRTDRGAGCDSLAHSEFTKVFDSCMGHIDTGHRYHYHFLPLCLFATLGITVPSRASYWKDMMNDANYTKYWPQYSDASPLIGWSLDGFAIMGPYDENGRLVDNSTLDACGGKIGSDGIYRYYASPAPPYFVGCFRGYPGTFNDTYIAKACPKKGVIKERTRECTPFTGPWFIFPTGTYGYYWGIFFICSTVFNGIVFLLFLWRVVELHHEPEMDRRMISAVLLLACSLSQTIFYAVDPNGTRGILHPVLLSLLYGIQFYSTDGILGLTVFKFFFTAVAVRKSRDIFTSPPLTPHESSSHQSKRMHQPLFKATPLAASKAKFARSESKAKLCASQSQAAVPSSKLSGTSLSPTRAANSSSLASADGRGLKSPLSESKVSPPPRAFRNSFSMASPRRRCRPQRENPIDAFLAVIEDQDDFNRKAVDEPLLPSQRHFDLRKEWFYVPFSSVYFPMLLIAFVTQTLLDVLRVYVKENYLWLGTCRIFYTGAGIILTFVFAWSFAQILSVLKFVPRKKRSVVYSHVFQGGRMVGACFILSNLDGYLRINSLEGGVIDDAYCVVLAIELTVKIVLYLVAWEEASVKRERHKNVVTSMLDRFVHQSSAFLLSQASALNLGNTLGNTSPRGTPRPVLNSRKPRRGSFTANTPNSIEGSFRAQSDTSSNVRTAPRARLAELRRSSLDVHPIKEENNSSNRKSRLRLWKTKKNNKKDSNVPEQLNLATELIEKMEMQLSQTSAMINQHTENHQASVERLEMHLRDEEGSEKDVELVKIPQAERKKVRDEKSVMDEAVRNQSIPSLFSTTDLHGQDTGCTVATAPSGDVSPMPPMIVPR
mmetsp:Transcript_20539/g.41401  ORF Transcript_20539/g.41401 Transcript_20539/m.41401 type:complete len:1148 (-) Transcript_20539:363-3806(-)